MRDTGAPPLHRRLLLLVAVAVLPLALLSLIGMLLLARQRGGEIERATIETMRAMASAVDAELDRQIAGLETLAQSRQLDTGNLADFYEDARRVVQGTLLWRTIVLTDDKGRQLLDVGKPFGGDAPFSEPDSVRRVIASGRPAVGNMVVPDVADAASFSVAVPVMREGRLKYVLVVQLNPDVMRRVIQRQRVPSHGVVSILDASRRHVARSRGYERFLAQLPAPGLLRLMERGAEGWGPSLTLEGQPIYAAFSRSATTGWTVAVGVPSEEVDAAMLRSTGALVLGVLLSALLGVLVSTLIARGITRPIAELRVAAQAVGRGETPQLVPSSIPEVREVAAALTSAARDRAAAEAEREELLRRERQARTAAEASNRTKDEFLAMLGHELRNPLAAIAGAVTLLEGRSRDSVAAKAERIARRQVEHLTRMMDDLLDVSRLMRGKIALERSVVDLGEIVREATASLQSAGRLGEHRITLDVASCFVDADATRIEQIVTNLLENAAKYTPSGGAIWVDVHEDAGSAVLRVRDDGQGMPAELLPRVFELFAQGERALDRTQGGLGIGLTLVQRLVKLHGGEVAAESSGLGQGSVFTVKLPAVAAPVGPRRDGAATSAGVARDVLIVEDNDDTREMLCELLQSAGHDVREAADGPAGVASAVERRPDVAVIDIGLPGLDGYQVAAQIRSRCTPPPLLIALTGYGAPEDRRRAYDAGFDLHMVKPVSLPVLERILAELRIDPQQRGG